MNRMFVEKMGFKRAEAATYLGVAAVTIDRLTKRGRGPRGQSRKKDTPHSSRVFIARLGARVVLSSPLFWPAFASSSSPPVLSSAAALRQACTAWVRLRARSFLQRP
jgi:hypothetical protein